MGPTTPQLVFLGEDLLLVGGEPGLFPDPLELEPGVAPDPDGGRLGGAHRLLDGLVELLGVEDQHVHGFLVLLSVHVLAHHGGFHRREDAQLCSQGGDLLANLVCQNKYFME